MGLNREHFTEWVGKRLGETSPLRGRCLKIELRSRITGGVIESYDVPPKIPAKKLTACVETLVDQVANDAYAHAENSGGLQRYVVQPFYEKVQGPHGEYPFYEQANGSSGNGLALSPGALALNPMGTDPMATLLNDPTVQSGDMSPLGMVMLNMRLQYGHNATMIAQGILSAQADTEKQRMLFDALMGELGRLRKENDELRGRYRAIEDQTNALTKEQHKREKELIQLRHDLAGKEMLRQKFADILAFIGSKVMRHFGGGMLDGKGGPSVMSPASQTLFKGLVDGLDREAIQTIAQSMPDTKRMQFIELIEQLVAEQSAASAANADGANGVKEGEGASKSGVQV
ncbi:MAG: hypothetical protein Q8S13_02715 [Dehalococcoidia bacterium]|nr:hypothetical protein [Dehalococcoidia bacterium]